MIGPKKETENVVNLVDEETESGMVSFERFERELGTAGIVRVLERWAAADRAERVEQILDKRLRGVTVVLVRLHDAHNGAAVLRTAEGLGIQHVHAVESTEPLRFSPNITIGCEKWMTIHRHGEFDSCSSALRSDGYGLWAAVPDGGCRLSMVPDDGPVALVLGNEREGLTPDVVEQCDGAFSLPMWGFTRNYNLSVSAALALAEMCERYRKRIGRPGDLGKQERASLRALWLFHSVRAAPMLLARAVEQRPLGSGR